MSNPKRIKQWYVGFEKGSIEDIFYVEEGVLPNVRGGFSRDSPLGVKDVFRGSNGKVRFPWEKPSPEDEMRNSVKQSDERRLARGSVSKDELPLEELIFAANGDSERVLSLLSSGGCSLEYSVSLLQVTEPPEEMEKALLSSSLSKQRVKYAVDYIKQSSATLLDPRGEGCGDAINCYVQQISAPGNV